MKVGILNKIRLFLEKRVVTLTLQTWEMLERVGLDARFCGYARVVGSNLPEITFRIAFTFISLFHCSSVSISIYINLKKKCPIFFYKKDSIF